MCYQSMSRVLEADAAISVIFNRRLGELDPNAQIIQGDVVSTIASPEQMQQLLHEATLEYLKSTENK